MITFTGPRGIACGMMALLLLGPLGRRHDGPRSIVADRIPYFKTLK